MDGVKIRELQRDDCIALEKLIQELADYQKMPNAAKLGAKELEEYAFGTNPRFYAYVAEFEGKLIGHAIYYETFSSWRGPSMFLDELYVTPDFRKKGIGSLLYDAVAKKTKNNNYSRLQYLVLKSNPAKEFYKNRGAVNLTEDAEWELYQVLGENL